MTALKNEIDKRFLSNGSETAPLETAVVGVGSSTAGMERETDQKSVRQEQVSVKFHVMCDCGRAVGHCGLLTFLFPWTSLSVHMDGCSSV